MVVPPESLNAKRLHNLNEQIENDEFVELLTDIRLPTYNLCTSAITNITNILRPTVDDGVQRRHENSKRCQLQQHRSASKNKTVKTMPQNMFSFLNVPNNKPGEVDVNSNGW